MNRIVITHVPLIYSIQVSWHMAKLFNIKWFKVFLEVCGCRNGALPLIIVANTNNKATCEMVADICDYLLGKACDVNVYTQSPLGNIGWIKFNYEILGNIRLFRDNILKVRKSGTVHTRRVKYTEILLLCSIPKIPPLD